MMTDEQLAEIGVRRKLSGKEKSDVAKLMAMHYIQTVGKWLKRVFVCLLCCILLAIMYMAAVNTINHGYKPMVNVEKPVKKVKYHAKKRVAKPHKAAIITQSDKPDIEEIEARLTTVEERLDEYGIPQIEEFGQ